MIEREKLVDVVREVPVTVERPKEVLIENRVEIEVIREVVKVWVRDLPLSVSLSRTRVRAPCFSTLHNQSVSNFSSSSCSSADTLHTRPFGYA